MRAVLLAATGAAAVVLSGCGGGSMLTSYDAEKARIRGVLAKEVQCTEQPYEATTQMDCRSPDGGLTLTMVGTKTSPTSVEVLLKLWDGKPDIQPASVDFRHVLESYGFDGADINKCLDEGKYTEQSATHRVECVNQPLSGAGVQAHVLPQKAV